MAVGAGALSFSGSLSRFASAQGPIVIGSVDSLSGVLASLGQFGRWGTVLAVNRINAAGGINGRLLEARFEDDTSTDPAAAAQKAEEFALAGVDMLTGTSNSASCVAIEPVAEDLGVPFILGTGCEADAIVGANCSKFTFRPYNHSVPQALALAPFVMDNLGTKVFIIHLDFVYGNSVKDNFVKEFEGLGGEILATIGTPLNTANWTPPVDSLSAAIDQARSDGKIGANDRPVVHVISSGGDAIRMYAALSERGLAVETGNPDDQPTQFFGVASNADINVLPAIGAAAAGTLIVHRFPALPDVTGTALDTSAVRKFREDLLGVSGGRAVIPAKFSQSAFNAVMVFRAAAEAVGYKGPDDRAALIDWLEGSGGTPTDAKFNPNNEVGRLFKEGDDFPQGNIFLRGADHTGFIRQFIVRVKDFGGDVGIAHEFVTETTVGAYDPASIGCKGLI